MYENSRCGPDEIVLGLINIDIDIDDEEISIAGLNRRGRVIKKGKKGASPEHSK